MNQETSDGEKRGEEDRREKCLDGDTIEDNHHLTIDKTNGKKHFLVCMTILILYQFIFIESCDSK